MKLVKGGITTPKGFKANGLCCGIKKSGKPDLGLIYSENLCVAAGVFTKNSVIAAPLIISKKHIKNNKSQAVVFNSGNANCFTGEFGLTYADKTTEIVGNLLGIKKQDVLVASTGIIGKALQFDKIKKSAPKLVKTLNKTNGSLKAAKALLTTDTKTKEISVRITLDGKPVTISACAKGSGMIAPNMATMLCFITTDVNISATMLKKALGIANEKSFNCITIDGCMSTNDMVVALANGLAGNKTISAAGKAFNAFCDALTLVCLDMAKKIVLDGEGATKFIEIDVSGAKTDKQAKDLALAVANSNLVKTAAFGNNPNWGRVAAAVGALGIKGITEKTIKINFSSFKRKKIIISIALGLGKGKATAYTSDLSYEYVRINAEYN